MQPTPSLHIQSCQTTYSKRRLHVRRAHEERTREEIEEDDLDLLVADFINRCDFRPNRSDLSISGANLVFDAGMVSIFDVKDISTLLNVVDTSKESIHLLESNLSGLRNEEEDKHDEKEVDASKEVECVAAT